jgi:hypothetical protein
MDRKRASELVWHRGRYDGDACVEATEFGEAILVRSSLDPDGAALALSCDKWREFLVVARVGRFEVPQP